MLPAAAQVGLLDLDRARARRPAGRPLAAGHHLARHGVDLIVRQEFRQALRLGHNYVGTEHILLALLEHEDGSGTLTGLGLDREAVESHVVRALSALTGAPQDPAAGPESG